MSALAVLREEPREAEPRTPPPVPERLPDPPGFLGRLLAALRYLARGVLPERGLLPDGRRVALEAGRLLIEGDFEIACTGSLAVRAGRHLFLESGTGLTPQGRRWVVSINGEREGYRPVVHGLDGVEVWDA